jgi:hypothetical protein
MSTVRTEEEDRHSSVWLEVANVRLVGTSVEVYVKGDRADREPVWRNIDLAKAGYSDDADRAYRTIVDGLDKNRIVLAKLVAGQGGQLKCELIRVQYTESNNR